MNTPSRILFETGPVGFLRVLIPSDSISGTEVGTDQEMHWPKNLELRWHN